MTDLSTVLANVTAIALVAMSLVQAATNGFKLVYPAAPGGVLIGFSILVGVLLVNLLALAAGLPFTVQTAALHTLAGLMAGFSAMGLHELGQRASDKRMSALYAVGYHDDSDNAAA